jgi:hypothetical protein
MTQRQRWHTLRAGCDTETQYEWRFCAKENLDVLAQDIARLDSALGG